MLHGGRLVCAGKLGVGSTFLLSVPREVGEQYTNPLTLRVAADEEVWGGAVVVAPQDELHEGEAAPKPVRATGTQSDRSDEHVEREDSYE